MVKCFIIETTLVNIHNSSHYFRIFIANMSWSVDANQFIHSLTSEKKTLSRTLKLNILNYREVYSAKIWRKKKRVFHAILSAFFSQSRGSVVEVPSFVYF